MALAPLGASQPVAPDTRNSPFLTKGEAARGTRPVAEDAIFHRNQADSHFARSSGFGNPPAWTTLPSMTTPGVEAMP